MKLRIVTLIVVSTLLSGIAGFKERDINNLLQVLKEKLAAYNTTYPEEKIHLQFDKPFYKPGEDIWFNGFILNSNTHKPTSISDVLYVELIDPKGNTVKTLELLVKEGTAHGDFNIAATASGGMYQIKAYTQWMKNFGDDSIFEKSIQIQRVITPRLLFKFDFSREAYGPGDIVSSTLTIRNLKNELVKNASVRMIIHLEGSKVHESVIISDENGTAVLGYTLPVEINTTDGLLQAIVATNGTEESISRAIPIVLDKIKLQIMPEGGTWMAGSDSKLAFKAVNEFGKGADVRGIIIDEKNQYICSFESFHMGMGAFAMTPVYGKKYFAKIESPTGNEALIALPEPQKAGFVMNLQEKQNSSIYWSIHASRPGTAFLTGQSHGELYFTEQVNLKEGKNRIQIPTEKFPAGIAVFTLFDEQGHEKCERLVFLNNDKKLQIKMTPDKQRYLPGEKVSVKIETTDHSGKPVPAKLALAVADDQLITFADDKQDNLLSTMYLSAEIKGKIQEPSFYFDPNEPKASEALDYLLLTQGWRRFSWKEVFEMNRRIVHVPEKVKSLSGTVTSKDGNPLQTEVTLMEMSNKKRISKVQTTNDGHFVFRNIDPTTTILLLTKKQGSFTLHQEKSEGISIRHTFHPSATPGMDGEISVQNNAVTKVPITEDKTNAVLSMSMTSDIAQLNEIVIVGFGEVNKQSLTGSITTIRQNDIDHMFAPSVELGLQGKVSGVQIQPKPLGLGSTVKIRGTSSLSNGIGEPLYVVDGHPIGNSLNPNFSNGSMISPDDILQIDVLHSGEATALYGSSAGNGAILITTKTAIGYAYREHIKKSERYTSKLVPPRTFSAVREFYVEPPSIRNLSKREDFRTTVYWNPLLITDQKGVANVSFYTNEAVSAFRMTAEGFSSDGNIGRKEELYYSILPFSLDTKIPAYLGYEDTLRLPVQVRNEAETVLTGKLSLNLSGGLSVRESTELSVQVNPGVTTTYYYTITSKSIQGEFPVSIKLKAGGKEDEISQLITVKPIGFPMRLSFSGKDLDKSVKFPVIDAEHGSMQASLEAFPDVLSDLMTGVESIFREPYGCFEQTSSSTFPNILALQYLKHSGDINPVIESKALKYIKDGYKRLISFEVKGGGFDWFGTPPAHEALTAYGLIEFHEMKTVYPEVDQKLIDRTRQWLLSRRNGDGSFKLQSHGLDDFSRPSGNIANTYITYALSETGETNLDKEYGYNLSGAWATKDMYQLALMANIAFNLKKTGDYEILIQHYEKISRAGALDNLQASHSIVRSQGVSLTNETVALWALAMMKAGNGKLPEIKKCIDHLISRRSFGMFGSTQSTVLSLKALSEYAKLTRATRSDGEIDLFVNNNLAESHHYKKGETSNIVMTAFASAIGSEGEQRLRVHFNNTSEPLPYSVNIQWYSKTPQTDKRSMVSLTTKLHAPVIKLNETVRMTAVLKNKTSEGIPMTMVILGIPAGLSPQPWQLKALQEKGIFDFYEIINNNLALYYRQLSPNETKTIQLDLKAEIPGRFTGAASSAYLYYTNEYKDWAKGNTILIQ